MAELPEIFLYYYNSKDKYKFLTVRKTIFNFAIPSKELPTEWIYQPSNGYSRIPLMPLLPKS
ncbi:hypothetical protein CLV98_103413 [Dyadobacter jejuensis]|uniref:Uncharacterized protein n=1 Tax=Dyadobacter jejuensis TaxID=1082580 RepID=A0A316AQI9_9BACT|nr:hypothetical protein CLV98_103413 [Dyadobacter jejuensis]